MFNLKLFEDGFELDDEYQDSDIFHFDSYARALAHVINSNSSLVLYYRILGTLDGVNWRSEVVEQTLAAGITAIHEITTPWAFLKMTAKIAPWGPLTQVWSHTTYGGGEWIDETEDAADDTAYDVKIAPMGNAAGRKDFIYYGYISKFTNIKITIDTVKDYADCETIGWEYWDGDSWERFTPTTDETDGNRVLGEELEVIYEEPADWDSCKVNTDSDPLYYIRFGGYANAQSGASAARVWVYVETGEITALMYGKKV